MCPGPLNGWSFDAKKITCQQISITCTDRKSFNWFRDENDCFTVCHSKFAITSTSPVDDMMSMENNKVEKNKNGETTGVEIQGRVHKDGESQDGESQVRVRKNAKSKAAVVKDGESHDGESQVRVRKNEKSKTEVVKDGESQDGESQVRVRKNVKSKAVVVKDGESHDGESQVRVRKNVKSKAAVVKDGESLDGLGSIKGESQIGDIQSGVGRDRNVMLEMNTNVKNKRRDSKNL